MTGAIIQRLRWSDPVLREIGFPGATMTLRYGFGSGLAVRPGDPPGRVWAVGDRGPNIKVEDAISRYGLNHLEPLAKLSGAKIMPLLEAGPALAELQVTEHGVELLRILPLTLADGRVITGLPNPASDNLLSEPVFDSAGVPILPDPEGLDTEGLVAMADGSFWVGDEFGPSLVRFDANGALLKRLLPRTLHTMDCPETLPAIAAKRQINRGFEALAISADEQHLFLSFQSPLAHPDEATHRLARHVRIWRLDAETGAAISQYAYPLDPPKTFARDVAAGPFGWADIKVSELLCLPGDVLLVLERGSATTKIYRCAFNAGALDNVHWSVANRPTLEELSADGGMSTLPVLAKELIFSSDDHPEISPDLEGMALLSSSELLLVNDNDFGVLGIETAFWRISLPKCVTDVGAEAR